MTKANDLDRHPQGRDLREPSKGAGREPAPADPRQTAAADATTATPTPPTDHEIRQKIRDVAALLQHPRRWTRRAVARRIDGWPVPATTYNAACWSLSGAIQKVCDDDPTVMKAVFARLNASIPPGNYRRGIGSKMEVFNDSAEHDDILTLLERAEAPPR